MSLSIIPTIIIQHAEEAAFLWFLRNNAVRAPHYSLKDLAKLDNRVEAHIDGLRIAGDEGWKICNEVLKWEEAGDLFTAAVLTFENGKDEWIETVLKAGEESYELSRGIVSALGWLPYEQAAVHIQKLLASDSSYLRRIGIAASAVHRKDIGKHIADALSSEDTLLKARALKAAGELGRKDLLPFISTLINDKDDNCRFWASWSAAFLGDGKAVPVLKTFALPSNPPHPDPLPQGERESSGAPSSLPQWLRGRSEEAVKLAMRRLVISAAHTWQEELAQNPKTLRLALIGAGIIGDPVMVPWLIEYMNTPEQARVAAEAFTMITGVDIAYEDLEGEKPEGFETGPTENPEDEDVEMDPDEDLAWPNPELILGWWNKNKGRFKSGTRYLLGQPIISENLQQVLRIGFQRQRYADALELAMMKPGTPLFEVRAPGFRQKQMLALK
jgi:hypothetical protein